MISMTTSNERTEKKAVRGVENEKRPQKEGERKYLKKRLGETQKSDTEQMTQDI